MFLSLASHELRTPLAGIRGNIQLALRRLEKSELSLNEATVERLCHPLEEAIHRAIAQDRMISDMLDVSRIHADRLAMVLRPCNLVEIVRRAVEDHQYLAPDHHIVLHEPAEEWIPIIADADRIGQVISNYLSNALKYSAVGRPVNLWLTKEGMTVRVSVKDEGAGLTSQQQQMLWQCFHRIKDIKVQYGTEGGLGLGLYLCRTIIEAHGGHVGVYSVIGQGSTFSYSLPMAPYSTVWHRRQPSDHAVYRYYATTILCNDHTIVNSIKTRKSTKARGGEVLSGVGFLGEEGGKEQQDAAICYDEKTKNDKPYWSRRASIFAR